MSGLNFSQFATCLINYALLTFALLEAKAHTPLPFLRIFVVQLLMQYDPVKNGVLNYSRESIYKVIQRAFIPTSI